MSLNHNSKINVDKGKMTMRVRYGEIKDEWALYFTKWPWEWWVTLTFEDTVDQDLARERLIDWTRKICVREKLQLAYMAVYNQRKRGHLHLLMLGRNRYGKTLRDVSIERCNKDWKAYSRIKPIENIYGLGPYLSKNLVLWNSDLSDIVFYNIKLLKKCKIKPGCSHG
jgi:hypothetical protein